MDTVAKFVLRTHGDMKGKRANWDSHWLEVTEHIIPRKRNVFDFRSQPGGEKRQNRIYDTTAIRANELLGSALHGMLTNPATQWFSLTTGLPEVDDIDEVKAWLQKAERKMFLVYANSNFNTQIHEVYLDLGAIGTASLRMEEDDETVVRFQARPIYEHHVKENFKGLVDTVSRELKMTGRQIKQRWNMEKVAKRLDPMDALKLQKFDEDPDKEWNMIHYVAPKKDFNEDDIDGIARRFKFVSVFVVEDLQIAMTVSGFEEFPYAVPRWTKTSSEIYGRGPGIVSLPDVKMINEMMRTHIRAGQKIVDPPLQMPDDGVMLPIRTTPGGINYYRAGTNDKIEPLITGGRLDISQAMMDDTRQSIRDAFFVDQLQLQEGPQMTATEVLQRTEEKLRLLGPVLGRLHSELLKPLIERTFGIMARRGMLPENPPEQLRDLDLDVRFSSQIARAQRSSEADNITRVINLMAPIAQVQPEMLDNIDGDGLLRFSGDLFDVPQEMFRTKEEVEQLRQQRQQAAQQQQQLQEQNMQSQTAKNLGVTAEG